MPESPFIGAFWFAILKKIKHGYRPKIMSILNMKKEGLFDPTKRFAFTNITAEPFTSKWGGVPVTVEAGETIEISNVTPIPGAGHAMAVKMTDELVDRIMIGEVKMEEDAKRGDNPYYRSPRGMQLGVPAARKVWEDKIIRELDPDEESPAMQTIRNQLRQEIIQQAEAQPDKEPVTGPVSMDEFVDVTKPQEPVKESKPARTKKIK